MKNIKTIALLSASMLLSSCGASNGIANKSFSALEAYTATYAEGCSESSMFYEGAPLTSAKDVRDRIVAIFTTNPSNYEENGKLNFSSNPGASNCTYEGKSVSTWSVNYGTDGDHFSSVRCYYTFDNNKGLFLDLDTSQASSGVYTWKKWSTSGFSMVDDQTYSWIIGNGEYSLSGNSLTTEFDVAVKINSGLNQMAHFSLSWSL